MSPIDGLTRRRHGRPDRTVWVCLLLVGAYRTWEAANGAFDRVIWGGHWIAGPCMTLVALGALWPLVDADSVHASMFAGIATIGGFGVMGVAAVLASSDRAFPTVALYLLVCVLVAERAPRRGLHVLERDVAA